MQTTRVEMYGDAKQVMNNALVALMHATGCTNEFQRNCIPAQLFFARNIFNQTTTSMIDRSESITTQLQKIRIYKYRIEEQEIIKIYDPTKSQKRLHGQYSITELSTNITARVQRNLNEWYIEETFKLPMFKL